MLPRTTEFFDSNPSTLLARRDWFAPRLTHAPTASLCLLPLGAVAKSSIADAGYQLRLRQILQAPVGDFANQSSQWLSALR